MQHEAPPIYRSCRGHRSARRKPIGNGRLKPPITGVSIDDVARTASGTISSTRNTPDNTQQLVCWLDGTTTGITGNCHARNLAGLMRACSTTNANLIQVIASANGDSYVSFAWNAMK